MRRAALLLILLLVLVPARAVAQSGKSGKSGDDRWQITVDGDRYIWDVRLVKLDGDKLQVRQADSVVSVPVADMTEIRLIRKSELTMGVGGGVGRAGAMAALTGADDEIYDLGPLEFAEKLRTIQQILLKYPPKDAAE